MASICFQQKEDGIPSTPLSNYGVHSAHADDEFSPFMLILRQSGTVQPLTLPTIVDLTSDDTDNDTDNDTKVSSAQENARGDPASQ
jgi:hypothetical protein